MLVGGTVANATNVFKLGGVRNPAVAKTDPYNLFNDFLDGSNFLTHPHPTAKITRSGSRGSYTYAVTGGNPQGANCSDNRRQGDAARFCNWLQNTQPTGPKDHA